jgi:hypothetical protein
MLSNQIGLILISFFNIDEPTAAVIAKEFTRLEIYCFQGSIAAPFRFHVVELLRLIMLDPPAIIGDPTVAYANHIVEAMWTFGAEGSVQYDTRDGRPYFLTQRRQPEPPYFQLDKFLTRKFSRCNCADLAAMIQICCLALGTSFSIPGEERPVSFV